MTFKSFTLFWFYNCFDKFNHLSIPTWQLLSHNEILIIPKMNNERNWEQWAKVIGRHAGTNFRLLPICFENLPTTLLTILHYSYYSLARTRTGFRLGPLPTPSRARCRRTTFELNIVPCEALRTVDLTWRLRPHSSGCCSFPFHNKPERRPKH